MKTAPDQPAKAETTKAESCPIPFVFCHKNYFSSNFCPKIACQVPKRPNPLKQKGIELAFSSTPSAILDI
jgi:hypothetical protein